MLDETLLQQRLNQFNPEPLVDYNEKIEDDIETHMIEEDENNIDLAKSNFLDVLNNEEIKKTSEDIIREYGVGTCGPRAFYGTTDVHLELEERLAAFFGMEESIVYSYGFVAISSSIAAYCKKNDVVFVDKKANFPIHQGLISARSKIVYFEHNDPQSLENEIEKVKKEEMKNKKKSSKFLIIEGINWQTGKICPLLDFLKVTEKHKLRIFLEESYSIGIMGKSGRGLTEHFDIDPSRIDMIFGVLEAAIGSIGGFCAGSKLTIEHQRLSGSGYIFSASLPTYLVKAVIKSIDLLQDKPQQFKKLAIKFHDFLVNDCRFNVESDAESPIKIFTVDNNDDDEKNQQVFNYCKENGVHFIKNENGLLINLPLSLNEGDRLDKVFKVLKSASTL